VLRVVGRRADGYHLLETLFHGLALHDDVVVTRTPRGRSITVSADRDELLVPADERNLAMRALAALQQQVGDDGGLHVHVHKRIPHGGGLGGGSSDAAATLRLANRLLGDPLDDAAMAALAVRLGADVPFFLRGGSQWGGGIGDELQVVPHIARHFVLVLPPFGCDTVAVYKNHAARWNDGAGADTVRRITVPKNRDAVMSIEYGNDLEAAAEELRPELVRLRQVAASAGYPGMRMSGSGSTLFVACDDAGAAARCRDELAAAMGTDDGARVGFVVTSSGPDADADQPSEPAGDGARGRPPDGEF